MDIDQIKIEPPTVEKEELELVRYENYEVKLENEEKPQVIEESTSVENIEKYEMGTEKINWYTCCYCGEKRELKEMAQTPRSDLELSKWSRILGDTILTSNLMICRNHFNDEFGDSRLIDVVYNSMYLETVIGDRVRCCYCEKMRITKSVTQVRRNARYFNQWVKILGQKFQECVLKKKTGYICRSHFNVEWSGIRPSHLLPIADLKDNKITETDDGIPMGHFSIKQNTCGYCEETKFFNDLIMVPQNPNGLKQWGDILGPEFYQRALSKKSTYICRSHLEFKCGDRRPNSALPRANYVKLPIVVKEELVNEVKLENEEKPPTLEEFRFGEMMESASGTVNQDVMRIDEVCLSTCCCCGKTRKCQEMVQVPKTHNEVFKWSKILGKQFLKNYTIMSMVCRSHFGKKFAAMNFVNVTHRKSIVIENKTETIRCCYCQKFGLADSMTTVSKYDSIFVEWVKILGEEFREHFKTNNDGVICKIHFACRWKGSRPSYLLPMANSKTGYTPQYSFFCIFCRKLKLQNELIIVPSNPMIIKQWAEILGEDFYRNALAKGQKFMCRNHIDVGWNHGPPGPSSCSKSVVMLSNEGTQVKLEEPAFKENLNQKPIHFLDIKPEYEHRNIESEGKIEKDSDFSSKMPTLIKQEIYNFQDGISDSKRIKIEVKNEDD